MARQTDNRRITRRLATPLAAIALLAVAWLAWDRYAVAPPDDGSTPAPISRESGGRELRGREIYYGPPHSLAVLPFTDDSPAGDQAPQALGFAGDVLERLALIPELRVTARSSSFFFRDPSTPPRLIAERLQSAFLLRGEWREAEGQVGLTASLFDARRDKEAWRKAYEGGLADLPALREALVRDAAAAMPGIGSKAATATGPASASAFDPAAWLLLQRGLYQADALTRPPSQPLAGADLLSAQASLQAALDRDPTFDGARLALAELWLHPAWPPDQDGAGVEGARRLAEQVLERPPGPAADPNSGAGRIRAEARLEAHIAARALGVLSYIRHRQDWDWQGAAEAGRGAVALHPGDAGLLMVAAVALATLAEFEEARVLLGASVERDPLNLGSRLRLGLLQEFSGLYDEALASYRQVLTLHPEYPAARAYRARVKALQGKGESALREAAQEANPFWRRYAQILALSAAERGEEAEPLLQAMVTEDGQVAAFQLAELYAFRGETENAFEWLQRARDQRDPGLGALLGNPLFDNLVRDPRWSEYLDQLDLPPELAPGLAPEMAPEMAPGWPLERPPDAQLDWSR